MPSKHHRIDYVELAALEPAPFQAFYGRVFGWTFQDWGPEYMSFEGAGLEGGVRLGEAPREGSTLVILYSDDLDATERAVLAAGAEVLEQHAFPGGRRFHFRDPCGNVLAVWTKGE